MKLNTVVSKALTLLLQAVEVAAQADASKLQPEDRAELRRWAKEMSAWLARRTS